MKQKKKRFLLIIQIKMLLNIIPWCSLKEIIDYLFILIQQLFIVSTIYLHNVGGGTQTLLHCHSFHHLEGICIYLLTNF